MPDPKHQRKPGMRVGLLMIVALVMAMIGTAFPASAQTESNADEHDLALHAPYTVQIGLAEPDMQQIESSYPDSNGELTDGELAGLSFQDPAWVGYLRQLSRSIIIDFGSVNTVHSLSADFLRDISVGIDLPSSVSYYMSLDGQTWHYAGSVANDGSITKSPAKQAFTLDGLKTATRYVKVSFEVPIWVFTDEITVMGVDGEEQGSTPPTGPIEKPQTDLGYLPEGTPQVGKVENMYLAYTYRSDSSNLELGT